jgi:hypothetical protein
MYYQEPSFLLLVVNHIRLIAASLLSVVTHLVLASSSWGCERSLWGPLLRALQFLFGYAILFGLVPVCGSAIVRRSSRSPSRFWCLSPCRLSGIKLVIPAVLQQFILVLEPTVDRGGVPDLSVSGDEEYLGPLSGFWWYNDTHLSG